MLSIFVFSFIVVSTLVTIGIFAHDLWEARQKINKVLNTNELNMKSLVQEIRDRKIFRAVEELRNDFDESA